MLPYIATIVASSTPPKPMASAADGCGFGLHEAAGRCEGNLPGPGARFDPANPGCWYNDNNDLRCY